MYIQVQMPQNGTENIFRDNRKTKKVTLMLLDVKVLRQS